VGVVLGVIGLVAALSSNATAGVQQRAVAAARRPDEIVCSAMQRKALSPNDFTNLDQIQQRLAAFEQRYNANAIQVEVHHSRPRRPTGPDRTPRTRANPTTP
jgi:hypothetical protein